MHYNYVLSKIHFCAISQQLLDFKKTVAAVNNQLSAGYINSPQICVFTIYAEIRKLKTFLCDYIACLVTWSHKNIFTRIDIPANTTSSHLINIKMVRKRKILLVSNILILSSECLSHMILHAKRYFLSINAT